MMCGRRLVVRINGMVKVNNAILPNQAQILISGNQLHTFTATILVALGEGDALMSPHSPASLPDVVKNHVTFPALPVREESSSLAAPSLTIAYTTWRRCQITQTSCEALPLWASLSTSIY